MVANKSTSKSKEPTLADALAVIKSKQFIDLTHAFEPGIPHWPGFPDEKRETLYWYEGDKGHLGKGFFAEQVTHVGQWGTHCDPPAHFVKGKRTIDQIDPKEMILPLVVIDVHEKVAKNSDYTISMDDVRDWERRHGPIPEGAFVAMRTDWSKRWPDAKAMRNEDSKGVAHYPGWSLAVLKYLYEERKVTASGHETTRHRSGDCHVEGRLLVGNLHPGHGPLSDRIAGESRQGARSWGHRGSDLPKAKGRLGVPGQGLCDCAVTRIDMTVTISA